LANISDSYAETITVYKLGTLLVAKIDGAGVECRCV